MTLESIYKAGFSGSDLECITVGDLVNNNVIERPLDGNHGEIHPKASDYVDTGIPFLMAADLRDGRVDLVGCHKIPSSVAEKLRKGFAKRGDIILSHKATLGRAAKLNQLDTKYAMLTPQTTYYRILDENKLNPEYLLYYFRSQYFQDIFNLWGARAQQEHI